MHNFADRHNCKIGVSCGDHAGCASTARRGLDVDLIRDTEPREKIGFKPDAACASGHGNAFGVEQKLFESLDRTHVWFWSPRPHRYAEWYARKIHVRSGGHSLRGNQLTEALPRKDNDIGRHATGELRGNRLRPCSLRRTGPRRDLDATCPLEFRQQLLVCATKSARYQNV